MLRERSAEDENAWRSVAKGERLRRSRLGMTVSRLRTLEAAFWQTDYDKIQEILNRFSSNSSNGKQ